MEREFCGDCRFFETLESMDYDAGSCRKNPPIVIEHSLVKSSTLDVEKLIFQRTWFPIIRQGEWCGEFSRAD